jgi:hypothetical protein
MLKKPKDQAENPFSLYHQWHPPGFRKLGRMNMSQVEKPIGEFAYGFTKRRAEILSGLQKIVETRVLLEG